MYTGTQPSLTPAIRAEKGWRGRRELAPRRSATQIRCMHRRRVWRDTHVVHKVRTTTTTSVAILAQVKLHACCFTWDEAKATIARAHSSVSDAVSGWRSRTTSLWLLPEAPSSLGTPLIAELLGGAKLAPLLVKFSLGMLLVFFLCVRASWVQQLAISQGGPSPLLCLKGV